MKNDNGHDILIVTLSSTGVYQIRCGHAWISNKVEDRELYADDVKYHNLHTTEDSIIDFTLDGSYLDPEWKKLGWKLVKANWALKWRAFRNIFKKSEPEEEYDEDE